jgi:hypothetical protein
MNNDDKKWNIYQVEEYYCQRMETLVDEERFDDSNAIFEEFVVNGEEPDEWIFMNYLEDVC